jgi:DNA-binding transcriptional MerR regulator
MLISEEAVCRELSIAPEDLQRWLDLGLIEKMETAGQAGFSPDQVRRIWSISSLLRDLDVNLEGVRIILDLSADLERMRKLLCHVTNAATTQQRVESFRLQVFQQLTGNAEWDIDL